MIWEWWTDLNDRTRKLSTFIASVLVIVGAASTLWSQVYTEAEAQAYQQQHQEQLARIRVDDQEARLWELEQKLDDEKDPQKRERIKREIKRVEDKIKCIREGKC